MAYAEHEFRNARPLSDGAPVGDHLASGARQLANLPGRKKPPPEVIPEGPPFPEELDYLWDWWIQLSRGLPQNGMGPAVVSWLDIQAWRIAMDIGPIDPWEADALVRLGLLRAVVQSEKAEAERRVKASAARG